MARRSFDPSQTGSARDPCDTLAAVAIEREIRFLVTEGSPPAGGREIVQGYLLRGRVSVRIRSVAEGEGWFAIKTPRREGRREWQCRIPAWLARGLLRLPLPRVEKTRAADGDLEIDDYRWPADLVVIECELADGEGPDLRDREGCRAWMEARRPAWVRAWRDVTTDVSMTAARLARRKR